MSRLSREEKLELVALLEEKERREKLSRPRYEPNPGQLPVHKSKAKIRFVASGNGAGKTTLLVHELIWRADGFNPVTGEYYPVPARIAIVLDKPQKFEEVFIEEAKKWFVFGPDELQKGGKPFISRIVRPNGSVITCYSHDQDALTYESSEIDFAGYDEPPPRHCFVGFFRGGRKRGRRARYLICGTPLGQPWLKEELWDPWERGERDDIECFRVHTSVNEKNLAENYLSEFSRILTEQEKRIRLGGEFFNLGGLALAHLFRRDTHTVPASKIAWDPSWPCVVSIDPHGSKPHHALLLGADNDNQLWALKELKLKETPRAFARQLKKFMQGYRVIDIVCDSLGSSEMSGGEGFKSFIQVLQEEGVRVRATTYDDKSDEEWMTRIQEALVLPAEADNFGRRRPKLLVSSVCEQLVKDIENVQWLRQKGTEDFKPKLDITHKDMLACLKYGLASNLHFKKPKDVAYYVTKPMYGFRPRALRHRLNQLKVVK